MLDKSTKRTFQIKRLLLGSALMLGALSVLSGAAHACTSPAGNAGEQIFNADAAVMQFCNGTEWVAMGGSSGIVGDGSAQFEAGGGNLFMTDGFFGVGTTSPTASIQLGDGTGDDSLFLSRSDSSTILDIYSSFDGGSDFNALTGAFAYGVDPSTDTFRIQAATTGAFADLLTIDAAGATNILGALDVAGALTTGGISATGASTFGDATFDNITVTNDGSFGGRVGIGVTSPAGLLQVGAGATGAFVIDSNVTSGYTATLDVTDSGVLFSNNSNARGYSFSNNTGDLLTITPTGNVGIRTTTPTNPLTVDSEGVTESGIRIQDGSGPAALEIASNPASTGGIIFTDTAGGNSGSISYSNPNDTFVFAPGGAGNVFSIDNSSHVGIGTSTPQEDLHIARPDPAIRFQDTNSANKIWNISATSTDFAIFEDDFAGVNNRFNIDVGGNIGLGTTSPAERLHVIGNGLFTGDVSANTFIGDGSGLSNVNAVTATSAGDANTLDGISSEQFLRSDIHNTTGATFAENVGIGTTTPNERLHVIGNGLFSGTVTATAFVGNGSGLTNIDVGAIDGPLSQWIDGTAGSISYSGGNVGVGTTTPLRTLTVQGDSVTTGEHRTISVQTSNGNESLTLGYDANGSIHTQAFVRTNNARPLVLGTNSAPNAVTILDAGNVGIGTQVPNSNLHIDGVNPVLNIQNTSTSGGSGGVLRFGHNQLNNQTPIGEIRGELNNGSAALRAGSLSFWTSSAGILGERVRITNTGNVGIGTTAPLSALHVVGDIRFTGDLLDTAGNPIVGSSVDFGAPSPVAIGSSITASSPGVITVYATELDNTTQCTLQATVGGVVVAREVSRDGLGAGFNGTVMSIAFPIAEGSNFNIGATSCQNEAAFFTSMSGAGATVSGAGSGLDADLLDGLDSTAFLQVGSSGDNIQDNTIDGTEIEDGSIGSIDIANSTITAADLAAGSVGASEVANNSVDSAAIIDGTITAADLAAGVIDGGNAQTLDGIDSANLARTDVATEVFQDRINTRVITTNNGTELILGGGEMGNNLANNISTGEFVYIGAEGGVRAISSPDNLASGFAGRHEATLINSAGNSIFPGNITATAYFHSSDLRLKKNIKKFENGLDLISQLNGVSYNWKDSGKASAGIIAQDVEKILPSAVGEREDGYKTVEYDQLIGPMVEAIKELKALNDAQAQENALLKARLENIEQQLGVREASLSK